MGASVDSTARVGLADPSDTGHEQSGGLKTLTLEGAHHIGRAEVIGVPLEDGGQGHRPPLVVHLHLPCIPNQKNR